MGAETYFASLSQRQSMLLLSAVTFAGQGCLSTFDFLQPHEAEIFKHRANELLQIPKERRIPLLATEIKRLLVNQRNALWVAEPIQLAEILKSERPAVVQLLLRVFPMALAQQIRVLLPAALASAPGEMEARAEILEVLRWKLREAMEKRGQRRTHFKFSDVLRLQARELLTLCDQLGARALAPAFAGLPTAERDAFWATLPPLQKQNAAKYAAATGLRKVSEKEARQILAKHQQFNGPAASLRSAGAEKLAQACLAQSAEFAARLLEKYRGKFGALLAHWVREARQRPSHRGDGGRGEIVGEMERLELAGYICKPAFLPAASKELVAQRPALPKPPEPELKTVPTEPAPSISGPRRVDEATWVSNLKGPSRGSPGHSG